MRFHIIVAAILCAGTIAANGTLAPARADTTIVTETITDTQVIGTSRDHLSDMGDLTKPLLLTVSYSKGKLSRFDTEQRIILRGLKDGMIEVLNPADLTYYMTTEAAEYARTATAGSLMSIAGGQGELRNKPDFTQLPETRVLQGATASGARFAFTIDYKFPKNAPQIPDIFRTTISGELWTSTSIPNAPGDVRSPNMLSALPKELRAELEKMDDKYKGTPLSFILEIDFEAAYREKHIKLQVIKHQDVRSISQEPLPDEMFQIPANYHEIPVPEKTADPSGDKPAAAPTSDVAPPAGV